VRTHGGLSRFYAPGEKDPLIDEGAKPIDRELLETLGEKVWPGGGGPAILRLVAEAKANQVPRVSLS
jgi:hypothetical protein